MNTNTNETQRTRLKICIFAFIITMIAAIAKHWLSGISETIILIADGTVLGYIMGETIRQSKINGEKK